MMEQENDQNRELKAQITAIRSGHRASIIDTLSEIRKASNTVILPELFNLLLEQEDEVIIQEVSSLLCDLKVPEAAALLVEALDNPAYQSITRILTEACWQNGLPYGEYADTFVRLTISADYETAIEAFTVLEEAIGDLEPACGFYSGVRACVSWSEEISCR